MDVCKDYVQLDDFEATVITLDMIREAVDGGRQGKKSSRQSALPSTSRDEGGVRETDFHAVERLLLPVKGIYRIDHLWILPNLTDLNLSCNNIQFIENLNCLPNLTKLNLACNKITKIEHIDLLLQIRHRVPSPVGLLRIQTGHRTSSTKTPRYNIYSGYVIAYLPQLVYFEYKLVTAPVQQKHREHYAADIERLEMEEQRISEENGREENDEKHLSDQKMAFIENLNRDQLFELMLDRDPYSHIVVMMKGDLPSIYERYQQEFAVYTQQMFQMGKAEYQKRTQDIDEFTETFENLKTQVNDKNRHIVEEFITKKAFIFYDISQLIREMEQTEDGDERETDEGKEKKMDEKEIEESNPVDPKEGKEIVEARSKWLKISSKVETKTVEPKANANGEAAPKETGDHDDLDNKDSSFDTNGSKGNR
ncbi:dynein regulatory complex subunit 3-like [Diaphorina citri]|uniref:Dynein axonemal assembly factor 1 homolog n=1 Tax=Diaphorina citri TaxID=121845 RepID=A0A3Q0JFY2_DIACI|nr:dynein regulatory complex subunit 3-like [Diaphorina citri]